ncbi:MAG TPA: 50S ribosomal protein L25, partial [Candidatus Ozemobacteraceae bacterium]
MAGLTLNAEVRTQTGQGPSRRARVAGQVPAVIYGRGVEQPIHCTLNRREIEMVIAKAQRNTIYKIAFGGKEKEREVIVREIQRHPINQTFAHIDFQAIDMTHPIKIDVDLKFVGDPVGKKSGAIFTTQLKTVRIECLPTKIPTELALDISPLDVGDSFHVADLPKGDYKILTSPKFTVC